MWSSSAHGYYDMVNSALPLGFLNRSLPISYISVLDSHLLLSLCDVLVCFELPPVRFNLFNILRYLNMHMNIFYIEDKEIINHW